MTLIYLAQTDDPEVGAQQAASRGVQLDYAAVAALQVVVHLRQLGVTEAAQGSRSEHRPHGENGYQRRTFATRRRIVAYIARPS